MILIAIIKTQKNDIISRYNQAEYIDILQRKKKNDFNKVKLIIIVTLKIFFSRKQYKIMDRSKKIRKRNTHQFNLKKKKNVSKPYTIKFCTMRKYFQRVK